MTVGDGFWCLFVTHTHTHTHTSKKTNRSRVNRTCPACRKKTGYDDTDCWVHLEEPDLDEIVEGLYAFIRKL